MTTAVWKGRKWRVGMCQVYTWDHSVWRSSRWTWLDVDLNYQI